MSKDKEHEIRLHFLEEAQEYLNTIESVLLELATSHSKEQIDAALRAAHSIKGGAAMMGFEALSKLAHRLEDFFKVLKSQKKPNADELSSQLLMAVDWMRAVIALYRTGERVEEQWIATHVNPVFEQLHERLGDPKSDNLLVEEPESEQNMVALLFESEVEGCLQRLESVLADPEKPCLLEECTILAQELSGLGEMLELNAFSSLCNSISQHLEATPERVEEIATLSLQEWRLAQALVLVGEFDKLPAQLDLPTSTTNGMVKDKFEEQIEVTQAPKEDMFFDFFSLTEEPESFEELFKLQIEAETATTNEVIPDASTAKSSMANLTPPTPLPYKGRGESKELITSNKSDIPTVETTSPELKTEPILSTHLQKAQEHTLRVPLKQLEQLNDLFGELTIERNSLDLRLKRLRNLVSILMRRVQVLEQSNVHLSQSYDKISPQAPVVSDTSALLALTSDLNINSLFDILEMDRYNDLHLLSQEVMETIVQIKEVSTDIEFNLEDTARNARQFNRTAKNLQSTLNQLRMRPLSDVVEKFSRALRDLCLEHGKNVELKIYGSGTLIDRTILEALNDPLMHLLRNAFDHGIEPPAIRRSLGKPEQGLIEIRAGYRGNQTLITISDDGGGIPLEKIREKAHKMGLDAADLAAVSEKELLDLIFEPGFSTVDKVTTLSGRGVGMDVVRTNIKQVRGDIKIDTQLGVGTTFTISVPFTLSVMRVLLVESQGMLLAFPRDAVEEIVLLKPALILKSGGSEVLNWEEFLVPLLHLSNWLEFHCPHKTFEIEGTPMISEPTVLMVSQGNELFGIKIERCWGEQEVAIRQVEGTIPMPSGLAGCTILGDGKIVPLVDVEALLQFLTKIRQPSSIDGYLQSQLESIEHSPPDVVPQSQKNTILVVDDSINVRRFLALTLEKAGYQVEEAKDGQDAIDKIIGGLQVQAVICDIEMPRLDGYGFLSRVKSNPAFSQLPVAMLTSRSGEKHRRLAMNLGAAAYFSKPYAEPELLDTLKELLQNKQLSATV